MLTKSRRPEGGLRPTDHINRRVTQSIFRGFDYATHSGMPLNLYVVINLRDALAASAATVFARVRHKYRDWLTHQRKKGLPVARPAYAFSFENPRGMTHVNWVVHVPASLRPDFERKLRRWVTRAQGECGPHDICCKAVDPAYAKRLAKYIVKGTDPDYVGHFHLGQVHAPQGVVWGKRAGVSPAIGKTARALAGFRPRRRGFPNRAGIAPVASSGLALSR